MASDTENTSDWEWAKMSPELTPRERQLRDAFVDQYLIDYDAHAAALRVGFQAAFAPDYAKKFMGETYVRQRLKMMEQTEPTVGAAIEDKYNNRRIKAKLMEEAFYTGPGSSHSARVSALKALAAIQGLEAPKKTESLNVHKGGVLMVPAIANLDDWEAVAVESQRALQTSARH